MIRAQVTRTLRAVVGDEIDIVKIQAVLGTTTVHGYWTTQHPSDLSR